MAHPCCKHCEDAKADHVEHGGSVEKDAHDLPCSLCEFQQHIRPRLEQAYDRAHDQYCDLAPHPVGKHHPDTNPYRSTP